METIKRVVISIYIAVALWVVVSYMEVVKTNQNPDGSVSGWNYFQMLTERRSE